MATDQEKKDGPDYSTRVQPGEIKNPNGRPKGSKNSAESVVRAAIRKAMRGKGNKTVIDQLKADGVAIDIDATVAEVIAEVQCLAAQQNDGLKNAEWTTNHTETPMPKELKVDGKFTHIEGGLSLTAQALRDFTRTPDEGDSKDPLPN